MPRTRGNAAVRSWHPEDIKAAVRKAYGSMAELARRHAVSESVVQTAILRVQPTGNRIIAAALDRSVHEIWPQWFDEAGNVRRPRPADGKHPGCQTQRQKAAAA